MHEGPPRQALRHAREAIVGGEVQRLPLIHLTVDQTGVVNLRIVSERLLQKLAQLLAVKIDCDVSVGVNITTCRDFSLLTYYSTVRQTFIPCSFSATL